MGASPHAGLHIQRVRQHKPYKEVATAGMQGKQKEEVTMWRGGSNASPVRIKTPFIKNLLLALAPAF